MRLYHRTDALEEIVEHGFRDNAGTYGTRNERVGVWLSDQPLDINEGAAGRYVLSLEMPEVDVAPFEWIEAGKGYREFLVPAALVNRYGPPALVAEEA